MNLWRRFPQLQRQLCNPGLRVFTCLHKGKEKSQFCKIWKWWNLAKVLRFKFKLCMGALNSSFWGLKSSHHWFLRGWGPHLPAESGPHEHKVKQVGPTPESNSILKCILGQKMVDPTKLEFQVKYIWGPKTFGPKKILGPINFGSKT